jgi:nitrogen regulatory protein PII
MKRIEAFVQYGKLEDVVPELEKAGVKGLTVFYARGRGEAERKKVHASRGTKLQEQRYNLIDSIVTIIDDSAVDTVVNTIKKYADASSKGIITVTDLLRVVKI